MSNFDNGITVIQGDILEVYFALENIPSDNIDKVFFTCKCKGIDAECEYSEEEDGYCLRLESEETRDLPAGVSTYDLTIRFTDGNDFTAVYNGAFSVLEKRNPVSEVQDE